MVHPVKNAKAVAAGTLSVLVLAVALLMTTAPSALAAPPEAAQNGPLGPGPIEGHLHTGRGEAQSTNWTGYAAYGQTFTEVQGSWVQPEAHCHALKGHQPALAAFWVGLDGYDNGTVEQIGTDADCEGTRAVAYAWYELYPERPFVIEEELQPGDLLHAKVTHETLELEDQTRGWTFTKEFSSPGLEFSSAEWIAESPFHRLAPFGSVGFSEASASTIAATGPIGAWEADDISLVPDNGRHAAALATPDPLEAGGSAFTITQP